MEGVDLRQGWPWRCSPTPATSLALFVLIIAFANRSGAHAMFNLPLLTSIQERASVGEWPSNSVATFGLVFVVLSCQRWER
jgi:hypothetical protein